MTTGPGEGDALGDDFDEAAFDAAFAKEFGDAFALEPEPGPVAPKQVIAVVLTPVASASTLARLLALAGVGVTVVPSRTGAFAAARLEVPADDMSELTGEAPEAARAIASVLSRTSKYGAVLVTSRMGTQADDGPAGRMAAERWVAGAVSETMAPGLVLAGADDVVEQILFGALEPDAAPGAIVPGVGPEKKGRFFGRRHRGGDQ